MRVIASATILLLLTLLSPSSSCETNVWQGGLWNLDFESDISTYGYFKFCLENDDAVPKNHFLKVLWIEKRHNLSQRIYAFRLFEDLELDFHIDNSLKIVMGDVPSEFHLSNNQGQKLTLRLWEPARFEIIKRK